MGTFTHAHTSASSTEKRGWLPPTRTPSAQTHTHTQKDTEKKHTHTHIQTQRAQQTCVDWGMRRGSSPGVMGRTVPGALSSAAPDPLSTVFCILLCKKRKARKKRCDGTREKSNDRQEDKVALSLRCQGTKTVRCVLLSTHHCNFPLRPFRRFYYYFWILYFRNWAIWCARGEAINIVMLLCNYLSEQILCLSFDTQ